MYQASKPGVKYQSQLICCGRPTDPWPRLTISVAYCTLWNMPGAYCGGNFFPETDGLILLLANSMLID